MTTEPPRKFQAPKGVSEYFPPQSALFEIVRDRLITPAKNAGYKLLELPIFEETELFARGVGESTDVVNKEMYTFDDRGGRSLTLRPEGTAGVMRSVIEHNLDRGQLPVKVWYTGPFFRAERPQAGRYRQFYQVGIEAIGSDDPAIDAEVISIAYNGFRNLGLTKFRLDVTSLGDSASRAAHRKELTTFLETFDLDETTRERARINPLRLFDDKRPDIQKRMQRAPLLKDFLTKESAEHFAQVLTYLDALKIPFHINPYMVRGLDYYTGTTFEFVHELLGAQSGIGGGGRYDGLMELLGGQKFSGIGFGLGVDRAVLACEAEGIDFPHHHSLDVYLIPLGNTQTDSPTMVHALALAQRLRNNGFSVDIAFGSRALKGAMKAADKSGARFTMVIGEDELSSGSAELKEMSTGKVQSVTLSALENYL